MALKGIIHDFKPSCLSSDIEGHSVLTLPVGSRYLINRLTDALAAVDCKDIHIVPAFEPDEAYWDQLCAACGGTHLTVVAPDARGELLLDGEPSDSLILIDPRYVPIDGLSLGRVLEEHRMHFGAVFLADAGYIGEDKVEHVVMDLEGNVRKVQRIYDPLVWSQHDATVVPCCVIPYTLAVHGPQFPLAAMRRRLAMRGVPMSDLPAGSRVAYLNRREDVLRFACEAARSPTTEDVRGLDAGRSRRGVRADASAVIAPSARLVGEVFVNAGACVRDGATIIGPAVLGRGATVGEGATVAQSLLMDRCVVEPGATVHQEVVMGRFREQGGPRQEFVRRPMPAAPDESFEVVGDARSRGLHLSPRFATTLAMKRVMDIAGSALMLAVLTPLLALTAILVKLTSAGPVFFTHSREGRNGRPFGCLKFRTMRTDAHDLQRKLAELNESDGPQFVIRRDPRVTRLGALLRATNIDELPQLFNVLAGQMSLVGPRPSPFRENQICAPWRRARLSVPPGITGLWQICRYDRHEGDFHQWIYFDTAYVKHVSLWLDIKILWYTLVTFGGLRSVSVERVLRDARVEKKLERQALTSVIT